MAIGVFGEPRERLDHRRSCFTLDHCPVRSNFDPVNRPRRGQEFGLGQQSRQGVPFLESGQVPGPFLDDPGTDRPRAEVIRELPVCASARSASTRK